MIVYVETNFIIEIIYDHEQQYYAIYILEAAEQGKLTLVLPSVCVAEAYTVVNRKQAERRAIAQDFDQRLRHLRRTQSLRERLMQLDSINTMLSEIETVEQDLLEQYLSRILLVSEPISLNANVFRLALDLQRKYGFDDLDHLVYASIISDLQERPTGEQKCFVSRDKKAFADDPDIRSELSLWNCAYFAQFAHCTSYLTNLLP